MIRKEVQFTFTLESIRIYMPKVGEYSSTIPRQDKGFLLFFCGQKSNDKSIQMKGQGQFNPEIRFQRREVKSRSSEHLHTGVGSVYGPHG